MSVRSPDLRALTQTGDTIHVVYDPDGNRIAEYDCDSTTGTSTLIRQYIWMEGRPVAVVEGGQIYFIRTDHIGRPVFATNNLGLKVWEASYLPFGGVYVATGGIDLRFPGQWFQAESGLHQNWMRTPKYGRKVPRAAPKGLAITQIGRLLVGPKLAAITHPPHANTLPDARPPPSWGGDGGGGPAQMTRAP